VTDFLLASPRGEKGFWDSLAESLFFAYSAYVGYEG
jgi:hypothetical protein